MPTPPTGRTPEHEPSLPRTAWPGLAQYVSSLAEQPVFVPGGPPMTPFAGTGPLTFFNPAYALHHARSWDSTFALGPILPLETAASPESDGARKLRGSVGEAVARLAEGPLPVVAQVWGPLTMAAKVAGTEEFLTATRRTAEAFALVDEGLERSLLLAGEVLAPRPHVLWIAEPLAAIMDPPSLAALWPDCMRRLVALARGAGSDPVVHVSGPATHALPAVATLGVSGMSITADTPLATARELLPPHLVVFGNLDSMRLIDRDAAWLTEAGRSMAAAMRGHAYVATPGSAIPPQTPLENLAAFVDGVRGRSV